MMWGHPSSFSAYERSPPPPFPVPGGKLCERGKSIAGTHWRVKGQSAGGASWLLAEHLHPRPPPACCGPSAQEHLHSFTLFSWIISRGEHILSSSESLAKLGEWSEGKPKPPASCSQRR